MRNTIFLCGILMSVSFASCKNADDKSDKGDQKAKEVKADTKEVVTTPVVEIKPDTAPETKPTAAEGEYTAKAELAPASKSKVAGTVSFSMKGDKVVVEAKLTGLSPGEHGFHVHEKGDCSSPDAKSAGGHFNPSGVDHGGPEAEMHHAGDLGNIVANAEGVAELKVELPTSFLSLDPEADNNIVGRAVIVHGGTDDMKSQPSGAAGPRFGCGVIKSL